MYLGHGKKTSAKDKSIANVDSIRFVVLPYQNQAIKKKKCSNIRDERAYDEIVVRTRSKLPNKSFEWRS